jgi:hypothetical protein
MYDEVLCLNVFFIIEFDEKKSKKIFILWIL